MSEASSTVPRQGKRMTRRGTIWRRVGVDWKNVFHRRTVVDA